MCAARSLTWMGFSLIRPLRTNDAGCVGRSFTAWRAVSLFIPHTEDALSIQFVHFGPILIPMLSSGGSRTLMRKTRAEPPRCLVPQHFLRRFQRAPGRLSLPLQGVWRRPGFSSQGLACLTFLLVLTMYPVASPIRSRTNWVPGSWVWNHRNVWSSRIARLESRQLRPRVARRLRCCPPTKSTPWSKRIGSFHR